MAILDEDAAQQEPGDEDAAQQEPGAQQQQQLQQQQRKQAAPLAAVSTITVDLAALSPATLAKLQVLQQGRAQPQG
jgi:hypothetical protein